jgi:hypothetical protein
MSTLVSWWPSTSHGNLISCTTRYQNLGAYTTRRLVGRPRSRIRGTVSLTAGMAITVHVVHSVVTWATPGSWDLTYCLVWWTSWPSRWRHYTTPKRRNAVQSQKSPMFNIGTTVSKLHGSFSQRLTPTITRLKTTDRRSHRKGKNIGHRA